MTPLYMAARYLGISYDDPKDDFTKVTTEALESILFGPYAHAYDAPTMEKAAQTIEKAVRSMEEEPCICFGPVSPKCPRHGGE